MVTSARRTDGPCSVEDAVKATDANVTPVSGAPSFRRRDHLLEIEEHIQRCWDAARVYEASAPEGSKKSGDDEKFFVTFPYPYMNGRAHLGHAYSATKAEFQARFQRLLGKNVLWPFAFHCTGMPIAACADRLKREFAERENTFEGIGTERSPISTRSDTSEAAGDVKELGKFSSKKSKAVQKTGTGTSQIEIMKMLDIPEDDIPKFQDPYHWLDFFPPLCKRCAIQGQTLRNNVCEVLHNGPAQVVTVEAKHFFYALSANLPYEHAWINGCWLILQSDIKRFGFAVDWRRSFITTDRNPYYDAFIRWQFNTLYKRGKVKFGMRPAVFSLIENQPCADHDRLAGEGVGPQEYTMIKMKVQLEKISAVPVPLTAALTAGPDGVQRQVYLVAATLRPETMFGQTNCFVQPEGTYGLYAAFDAVPEITASDAGVDARGVRQLTYSKAEILAGVSSSGDVSFRSIFVMSARAARNAAVQGILPSFRASEEVEPEPYCYETISGTDLIGLPLSAPNAQFDTVYTLPMFGVSMDKGTGVVTSVPSDAPDDWAALRDLKEKPALREKYGITEEMVAMDVVEIIDIPGLGRRAAVDICETKKIRSQNDKTLLAEAKEEVYKRGFYEGVMVLGPLAGSKVCDAKAAIKDELVKRNEAVIYYEPEKLVLSRSGDECVVALCNQWYLDYGEQTWTDAVMKHVKDPALFNAYSQRSLNQFEMTVDWLKGWACSRHYGLGSYLPWEVAQKTLIESLSDSTIYMAYYTIAHLLQGDINGDVPGSLGLAAADLTDDVFDYVFLQTDVPPASCNISKAKLEAMRDEFAYWYPMNLRVSGKDLIGNHLTMTLFNHAAIWPTLEKETWPRGFFCNGFILVNSEKMSKAAGNFMTLENAIKEFSADATRIGLADAGDSLDDANFQKDTANSAIMRLYLLEQFVSETIGAQCDVYRGEKRWIDLCFEAKMAELVSKAKDSYERLVYRDALKYGFFDFSSAKDTYKNMCGQTLMHLDCCLTWVRTQLVILYPIAPHTCDYIWTETLGEADLLAQSGRWPILTPTNPALVRELEFLISAADDFRKYKESVIATAKKQQSKKKDLILPVCDKAVIYVAKQYAPIQESVLKVLHECLVDENGNLDDAAVSSGAYMAVLRQHPSIVNLDKKQVKEALGFAQYRVKTELPLRGVAALELAAPYDEIDLLMKNVDFLKRNLGLSSVSIVPAALGKVPEDSSERVSTASPSRPAIVFIN